MELLAVLAIPFAGGLILAMFGQSRRAPELNVAFSLGTILAIPSGVGLWAMAGANADDAEPALARPVRIVLAGVAVAAVVATVVVCLTTGSAVFVLNLGLIALVALAALGLAGAAYLSPHFGRAASADVTP